MRRRSLLGALALLSVVPYLPFLNASFQYDDEPTILHNGWVRDLGLLPKFFTGPEIDPQRTFAGTWRPLTMTTISLNYAVGGTNPWAYRLTNLLIHVGVVVALFLLLLRLKVAERLAFGTSMLFALHPLHSQSIMMAWKRSGLLSALFMILGLLAFERLRGWKRIAGCLGAMALALMCKEDGVIFPVLLIGLWLSFPYLRQGRAVATIIGAFALSAIFAVIWQGWIRTKGEVSAANLATVTLAPIQYWGLQLLGLWRTLGLMLVPLRLNVDHRLPGPGVTNLDYAAAFFGIGLVLLMVVVATLRDRRFLWCVALIFVPLLLYFAVRLTIRMDEARTYLPLAGVAAGWAFLMERFAVRKVIGVAALVGTLFLARDFHRGWQWSSGVRLWADSVSQDPGNVRALNALSFALLREGRGEGALKFARQATTLAPRDANSWIALGQAQEAASDTAARASYEQALGLKPNSPDAWNNLGAWWADRREWDEALRCFERAVAIDPYLLPAQRNRERVLMLRMERSND